MAQFKGAPNLFGNNNTSKPEVKKQEPVKEEKKEIKKTEPVVKEKKQEPKKEEIKKTETVKPEVKNETVMPEPEKEQYVSRLVPRNTSNIGRPRHEGEFKHVSIRLTVENYEEAVIEGAKFGGMTAFIGYLIEEYKKNKKD